MTEKPKKPLRQGALGSALSAFHRAGAHMASATWRPLADVYRVEEGWIVKFELAGVAAEDIHIYAHSRKLTVSGVRRDTVHEHACSHYLMEISYNRFERTIELPVDFDSRHLLMEYRNGILLIRINTSAAAAAETAAGGAGTH